MERTYKLDPRLLLVVGAVVAVALTIWAAGAFAAGGSSSNGGGPSDAAYIQSQGNQSAPDGDCPHEQGGAGSGSGSTSDGSGTGNL